jgi:hypothetical protein
MGLGSVGCCVQRVEIKVGLKNKDQKWKHQNRPIPQFETTANSRNTSHRTGLSTGLNPPSMFPDPSFGFKVDDVVLDLGGL